MKRESRLDNCEPKIFILALILLGLEGLFTEYDALRFQCFAESPDVGSIVFRNCSLLQVFIKIFCLASEQFHELEQSSAYLLLLLLVVLR